jgi:ABC-type multidrug transport system fused ATPase/permease subunit
VITVYACLALALTILTAINNVHVLSMLTAAAVLRLVAALLAMPLSTVEHSRNPRPSTLLTAYMCLTLILDAAQARTLFRSSSSDVERVYSGTFCATVASKAVILMFESRQKTSWVRWPNDEKHSPEETSSILSLGVFFWLNKLFLAGYRTILTMETILPLDSSFDPDTLHTEFSRHRSYEKLKSSKFGLAKALARTLRVPLLLPIAPRLALLGFTLSQPFFLETLLDYLAEPTLDPDVGYGLIGASFLIYSGIAISTALTWYFHHRFRVMIQSILVPEVFLKATMAQIGDSDNNAALTLMSTDLERIRMGFRGLHEVWACLIQVALAAWMLYIRLGIAFVAAMGLVVLCFICLGVLLNFIGDSQKAWMARVQMRVGLTASVIAGMKSLKISGLSTAVRDYVQKLRVEELAAGARYRRLYIAAAILGYVPLLIGPPLTFAFAQRALDTSRVFTSLSFLALMTIPLSQIFQYIPEIVSGLACLSRIQAFLECETRTDVRQLLSKIEAPQDEVLVVKDGNFGWEPDTCILSNVNFCLVESSLNMVVGPVASGKSTMCKALLSEMPFNEGQVKLRAQHRHVGYCDQNAYLFNGSVKENIVGFSVFDPMRYSEVIEATGLSYDLARLPQGNNTNVGSDGITLSGGQKKRISLARALYLQTDLLILDDVFSGLDAETEEHVFDQVFGMHGLLRKRGATVVLCTNSLQHLRAADHIIVLGHGTVAAQGTFEQLQASQAFNHHTISQKSTPTKSKSSTESPAQSQPQLPEELETRTVSVAPNIDAARQIGDSSVYKHWIKSMGMPLALYSGIFAALWGFFTTFPTVWLTFWTEDMKSSNRVHSSAYYVGIYGLLQACSTIALVLLGVTVLISSVKKVGASIHGKALQTLVQAPLAFFTNTDTGVITNLFSQDLNLIDTELPDATISLLITLTQSIGQVAVMLMSSAYLAISYPFLAVLLYVVQRFYLRTSRQMRLLDLEAKSPLYTHFLDTVRGITTLRAFGFVSDDVQKNARLTKSNQRPSYLLLMVQEWLSCVLNVVVMIMAVILTTLAIQLHSKSGFAGASLYSLLTLGENLSGIVLCWTKLETSLGAIARLKAFGDTVTPENTEEENIVPPEQWPEFGVVAINGVSASYEEQHEGGGTPKVALHDIHLNIASGEKVAICGRTGSGKSSLIAYLLKLLDPLPETADNAMIDEIPLRRLDRQALRQRIIAVPQESVFLPDGSTFQANLDPISVSTSEECREVLEAVGLWQFVSERGGLEAGMTSGTFSAGQRQLYSVGRALLRQRVRARQQVRGGILLLDEVSSSVDIETERLMQEIIKNEFEGYTVIAVSHRLDMISDFDRVIVMDTGEIVEIGNPIELAGVEGSRFGDLIRAAR